MKILIVVIFSLITLQFCMASSGNNVPKTNVTCLTDARGVTHCRDRNTGRSWIIMPSPVGTYIHS